MVCCGTQEYDIACSTVHICQTGTVFFPERSWLIQNWKELFRNVYAKRRCRKMCCMWWILEFLQYFFQKIRGNCIAKSITFNLSSNKKFLSLIKRRCRKMCCMWWMCRRLPRFRIRCKRTRWSYWERMLGMPELCADLPSSWHKHF